MKRFLNKAAALTAALAIAVCSVSCGKGKSESSFAEPFVGQFTENPDEPEMGRYTVSEHGTKLYYSPDEFDAGLIEMLEKYFLSIEEKNYDSYLECIETSYAENMEKYLREEYDYGLDNSFATQCSNFTAKAGAECKITRLKLEPYPEDVTNSDGTLYDGIKEYLDRLGEMFDDKDYCENMKSNYDKLHYAMFFLMAKTEEDGEFLMYKEVEILIAEKDGKFYTFG